MQRPAASLSATGLTGCPDCSAPFHCAFSGKYHIALHNINNINLFSLKIQNLPHSILKNVFSCWSGLIDVYLLPNKNCGYVKYAEAESAQMAISVLNGAEICGAKIKVRGSRQQN